MNKKTTLQYLIGTFLLSYIAWGIIIIANRFGYLEFGKPLTIILYMVGGLSPTIVSYNVLKRTKAINGIKAFAKETFALKQHPIFYVLVIVFLVLYFGIPTIMGYTTNAAPWYLGIALIIPMILGGGLEELGWRYILQPSLEKCLPFSIATNITSLIWWLWHLPLFYIAGTAQNTMNFWMFGIMVFGLGFSLSSIYRTSQSIWLCVLLHAMTNAFSSVWIIAEEFQARIFPTLAMTFFSILIVTYYNKKKSS